MSSSTDLVPLDMVLTRVGAEALPRCGTGTSLATRSPRRAPYGLALGLLVAVRTEPLASTPPSRLTRSAGWPHAQWIRAQRTSWRDDDEAGRVSA